MAWLFLGLAALPLAAAVYFVAQRLAPRLLEPVPTPSPPEAPQAAERRGRWQLPIQQTRYLRAAGAIVVLGLVAFGVSRWPSASRGSASVPRSVEVQLPPPGPLKVQTRFGSDGSGQDQLHDPRDIAIDPSGNIYVADTGNKRITKFRPDGSFASTWPESAKGPLLEPSSLAVAKDGLIVDDSEAAQLHKYDFDGKSVPAFEHDLNLSHPRGIAVGSDGTIYVADTANNRIAQVGPDGVPRGVFDTKGAKLEQPTSVAVDDQGGIYSIEPAASRIQKFAPDGTLQAHLFMPPSVTVHPPRGIWIPGRGLAVSLPEHNELVTYNPAGVPQATFAPEGPAVARPLGLALASDKQSVWVVWNATSSATLLLWP